MDDESTKFFENHVLSVCSALGGKDGERYLAGDEAMGICFVMRMFTGFEAVSSDG
jgi:hypothetical protein